jgi:dipeptide/tripeptide permease
VAVELHGAVGNGVVHVMVQIPQNVFIAAAETLVSVNGLNFAFSEAGPHMGSLLQAAWALMQLGQLLTGAIALGDVAPYALHA